MKFGHSLLTQGSTQAKMRIKHKGLRVKESKKYIQKAVNNFTKVVDTFGGEKTVFAMKRCIGLIAYSGVNTLLKNHEFRKLSESVQ